MSIVSAEFWHRALEFDEWRRWHYILPGGEFEIVNRSNAMARAFRRPTLVCVRSTSLADNTLKIVPILRDACRRQLREHSPGVIHVLINTNLFGLAEKASVGYIETAVREATAEIFRNYSRVLRILYDLVTPPEPGQYQTQVSRVSIVNERCEHPCPAYSEPPPILLL